MPRRPIPYHGDPVIRTLPGVAEALDLPRHIGQAECHLLAASKADLERRFPTMHADWRPSRSYTTARDLEAVGLIGDLPVLFARAAKDNVIVRLGADGSLEHVATWRYAHSRDGRGLYVELMP